MMITPAGALRLLRTVCLLALSASAAAADLTLVVGDDASAYSEFVAQMQATHDKAGASGALKLVNVGDLRSPGVAIAAGGDDAVDPNVAAARGRTRSIAPWPRTAPPPAAPDLLVGVGAQAARGLLERPGNESVLLTMLSRLDYESLRKLPSMARGDRAVGILLRDPPMSQQLALIVAILPDQRRIGVVATRAAQPLLQELRRTPGWQVSVADASDPQALARAIRAVVPESEALLVLPDSVGTTAATSLVVLQAAATARLPVFATSEAMVRAGALGAVVARPDDLAEQAYALGQRLRQAAPGQVVVEHPRRVAVRTNTHVAQALGLGPLPDVGELAVKIAAVAR